MRVLLIEDDSATAQSIELMLQSEGFNVYTTDLGEDAIELAELLLFELRDLIPQLADRVLERLNQRFEPKDAFLGSASHATELHPMMR